MICPVCKKDALIVEYDKIELDYCPECQGVWFDAGELELLLESTGLGDYQRYLEDISNSPEVKTLEKIRKCPICRHKMKKVHIDEEKETLVDICHAGDGIWFDGGEVQNLVKTLAKKSSKKDASQGILDFVGDLFQHRKE